jgi:hypothetical protein
MLNHDNYSSAIAAKLRLEGKSMLIKYDLAIKYGHLYGIEIHNRRYFFAQLGEFKPFFSKFDISSALTGLL